MAATILGVAIGPGLVHVVELSYDAKSAKLLKAAEFKFPEGESLSKPIDLGRKFGEFLKQQKFGARTVIAGLPTQWLMLKEKVVPEMSADNLAGMLRLQAERDFSLDPNDLALDFVSGVAEGPGSRPLLLAACLKVRAEQIAAILKAAGLTLRGLTSSSLALAAGMNCGSLLSAGTFGAELIVHSRGGLYAPCMLASTLADGVAWIPSAAAEGRRALALRATDPTAQVGLYNGVGLGGDDIEALAAGLEVPLKPVANLGGIDQAGVPNAARYGHAAALAWLGKSPKSMTLNFMASKLEEKRQGFFDKFTWWMGAAVLMLVAGVAWMAVSWYQDSAELASLKKTSDVRKTQVEEAKAFVSHFASSQGWYEKRPNHLDCMKELLHVIPTDGSAWLTDLQVKDDFRCIVSAKAANDKRYFEVLDRIEKNQAFRDVRLVFMIQQDKKKPDVAFAISFVYWKPEGRNVKTEDKTPKAEVIKADFQDPKPEDVAQKPDDAPLPDERVQKTEDRGQKAEDRGQRTEDRTQRTDRNLRFENNNRGGRTDRGQRTDDRTQRLDNRGQRQDRQDSKIQKTDTPPEF